jgi:hypothetical protein
MLDQIQDLGINGIKVVRQVFLLCGDYRIILAPVHAAFGGFLANIFSKLPKGFTFSGKA